jgi:hypothetical protein
MVSFQKRWYLFSWYSNSRLSKEPKIHHHIQKRLALDIVLR